MGRLSRLSAAGSIKHEVGYYLPDDLKTAPEAKNVSFQVSDLNAPQKKRFRIRFIQIKAIEDMVAEGIILPRTADIEAYADEIEKRAAAYFKEEATERDLIDHALENGQLPARIAKSVRKGKGGKKKKRCGNIHTRLSSQTLPQLSEIRARRLGGQPF